MATQVTCGCGKPFQVRNELRGKQVKCPWCGKVSTTPGPVASPAPEASLTLQCPCGQRSRVGSRLAGKRVACPSCSRELKIPGRPAPPAPAVDTAPPSSDDTFWDDALSEPTPSGLQPSRRPEPESPAAKGTPKSARRAISIDISGKQIGGICLILFGAMLLCWGGFNLFVEQVIPWIKVAGAIIMGLFWMNLGWGLLQKR